MSWNVNGLRSCVQRGFASWLGRCGADVVAVQEARVTEEQLPPEVRRLRSWSFALHAAQQPGYSGVALLSRRPPDELEISLGAPRFDREGRFQCARIGRLWVVNSYFPSGNGKNYDLSRIPYKLAYTRAVRRHLQRLLDAGERVVIVGDFNTARTPIDLARPAQNKRSSGFRPEEREEFDRWIQAGWTDTYRHLHPDEVRYSWWSQRAGCRERNVGWRLDYALVSPAALPFVRGAEIHTRVKGSDHCPVSVDFVPEVGGD